LLLTRELKNLFDFDVDSINFDDNGILIDFGNKTIDFIIDRKMYNAGLAVYRLTEYKNYTLNMFLTAMMLADENFVDYAILQR
jgi:hypothetical protein